MTKSKTKNKCKAFALGKNGEAALSAAALVATALVFTGCKQAAQPTASAPKPST